MGISRTVNLVILLFVIVVAAEILQCNLDAAGYLAVRETKSTTNWHTATDNLAGTDEYGTTGITVQWSVKFS